MNSSGRALRFRRYFPFVLAMLCTLVFAVFYAVVVWLWAEPIYADLKHPQLLPMQNVGKTIGRPFDFDPEIGGVPAANASGVYLIPKGSPIAFHHDDEGLVAPLGVKHVFEGERHPRLLFLGDSFTYGSLVPAKDSFAFLSASRLGGEAINGGAPGYGLAQMVLRARKMIPKYQPDYVIVQYSPWLAERSKTEFSTDSRGVVMAPYFYDDGMTVRVEPVPFLPPDHLVSAAEHYKVSAPGAWDKASFMLQVALPFSVHVTAHLAAFRARQWLGLSPRPSQRSDEITRAAYAEIDSIARQHGAKVVILALGDASLLTVPEYLLPPGVAGVHAWREMVSRLEPRTPDEYVRQYYHWRGEPPEPVDWHPNEHAHAVIAEVLAERIRQLDMGRDFHESH